MAVDVKNTAPCGPRARYRTEASVCPRLGSNRSLDSAAGAMAGRSNRTEMRTVRISMNRNGELGARRRGDVARRRSQRDGRDSGLLSRDCERAARIAAIEIDQRGC